MTNNARNDLISYYKVIGCSSEDCSILMNISEDRVWLYWKLISIHVYQGCSDASKLKLDRDKYKKQ